MGKVFGRPLVLVPVGTLLVLVGLLVALNGVGAWRWGGVLADERWCESGRQDMCLLREEATIDGPSYTRRQAGEEWVVRPASGGSHEVDLPGEASDVLEEQGTSEVVALTQPDGDLVGVEAEGRVVGTVWVGWYGVLQLVGLGLLVIGLGAGLGVAGWRIRRSTGSWGRAASVREHGSAWVAIPVVGGAVLWLLPRLVL